MSDWLGPTDCRVCAAMRERKGGFLLAGAASAVEGILWLALAAVVPVALGLGSVLPYPFSIATLAWAIPIVLIAIAGTRLAKLRILLGIAIWLDRRLAPGLFERAIEGKLRGQNYGTELVADLERLRSFIAGPTLASLYDVVWVPFALAAALWVDPIAGLVAVSAAAGLCLLIFLSERNSRKSRYESDVRTMLCAQRLGAAHRYAEDLDAMAMMPQVNARLVEQYGLRINVARQEIRRTHKLAILCTALSAAALGGCASAVALGFSGPASPAAAIASLAVTALAVLPLAAAVRRWQEIGSARETVTRLKAFAMSPPRRNPEVAAAAPRDGALTAKRLYYGTAPGAPLILNDVSFRLEPGESLAVIGASGAGKSVLARLLVGVLAPTSGAVELGGSNVFDLDPAQSPSAIGYMRQDVQLFDTDIAENIARLATVGAEAVVNAARLADVHELISGLSHQYRTPVGIDGELLAGGVRQRIALARAVYGSPHLVVLDEPNSSLDGDGEIALLRTLARLKAAETTVVLITQRPTIVRHADKLLILSGGRAEAFGPREEVLVSLAGRAA